MSGGEKKYSCDRCGKGYQTNYKHNLLRHIRNIHEGDVKSNKGGVFKCNEADWCNYQTMNSSNLKRHVQSKHRTRKMRVCEICGEFTTKSLEVMKNHQAKEHRNQIIPNHRCQLCHVSFSSNEDFQSHLNNKHPSEKSFELIEHAFEKRLRIYKRNIRAKAVDTSCLWPVFNDFKNLCRRIIVESFPVMKFNLALYGIFERLSPDETDHETEIFVLKSIHFTIKPHTKLKSIWASIIKNFDERIDEYLLKGSGWALTGLNIFLKVEDLLFLRLMRVLNVHDLTLRKIFTPELTEVLKVHVEVSKIEALQFSCQELQFSPNLATENVQGKRHLVNIINSSYNCFLNCLAFHYLKKEKSKIKTQNLKDVSKHHELYKDFIERLDFANTGIFPPYNKPIGIKKMKKLLKQNKKILGNLQINIFGLLDAEIYSYEIGIGNKKSE